MEHTHTHTHIHTHTHTRARAQTRAVNTPKPLAAARPDTKPLVATKWQRVRSSRHSQPDR